ncbi:hypothetical protein ACQ4M4_04020 [Leptolyngbya sp. AN02str]|uniref:hypothetical protein n=1 Tax=Leptolyngbya sp. AN02str TaxID=3423363 RepID=UPI003D31DBF2
MRRRAALELESPVSASLHPMVQSTLGCMDAGLDEELARYRRSRRVAQLQERSGLDPASKSYTISLNPNPTRFKGESTASSLHLPMVPASGMGDDTAPPIAVQGFTAETVSQPKAKAVGISSLPDNEDPSEYLESSEQLLRSLNHDEPRLRRPQPSMLSTLITPLGLGSMMLLLLTSVTFGYVLMNPATLAGLNWFRAGTSEEATDPTSLDETATTTQPQPPGLGPNLSSQEFQDVNLGTLSTLPDQDGVRPGSPLASPGQRPESAGTSATGSTSTTPERTITRIGTEAELSTVEQLANGQRRPGTPPAAESNNSSSQQEVETPRPRASTAPATPASPRTSPAPAPAASAPAARPAAPSPAPVAASPAPAASAPASSRSNSSDPYYYVVTDYTSDRALDNARDVVPDAFVRNGSSGALVQFGAFTESTRAETLVRELQQQGISARVYKAD